MIHLVVILTLLATSVAPGEVEIARLDGSKIAGQITAWEAAGITLSTAAGPQTVASNDLLSFTAPTGASNPPAFVSTVQLIDGTRFPIDAFRVTKRMAVITRPLHSESIRVPTQVIRRVDFRPASDPLASTWHRVEAREAAGDALIIAKGDGETFDYLSGVVNSVTDEQVVFDWDGQKVPIKRSKVAGIAFYQSEPRKLSETACTLTTTDGMTITARSVTLSGDALQIMTPANVALVVSLQSIASADFSSGKLSYLSDLKPTASRWTPRVALPKPAEIVREFGAPRADTSYAGSALTLAWPDDSQGTGHAIRTYAKGLALRSRTTLTYRLPTGMKRFTAIAGIDPATCEQGHVVLEIRADDRVVWEGEIDGKQPPVEIDADVASAHRLQILVDYGRNLDYGDRLNLVEARVTK